MSEDTDRLDQQVRHFVYTYFVEQTRPPTTGETAGHLNIDPDDAAAAYRRLDRKHAFFLEPGTLDIRMANPLSAVPTDYRVFVDERPQWANCAWDAFGVAAMLHADVRVDALYAESREPVTFRIENEQIHDLAGIIHYCSAQGTTSLVLVGECAFSPF